VALAALAVIFSLKAQEGPPAPPNPNGRAPKEVSQAAVERGKTLFQQNCAVCHGQDLTGGRGPDLIRSSLVRHDKGGNLILPVVLNGRADRGMPSFPFTQEQVSDIVAYIDSELTLFDLHTRIPVGYPNDIPASRLATGSVEAGKAFFDGPGGCTKCHSVTGDLAGIAKKLEPPDLETHFLYPPGVPDTATVMLPSGKTFEGTLVLNDGFNVGIQGTDGWYHSWPRSGVKLEVHNPLAAHAALLDTYTDQEMHDVFTYLETLK
jgi:cytochrome c oxidase cbb3-type subunit III